MEADIDVTDAREAINAERLIVQELEVLDATGTEKVLRVHEENSSCKAEWTQVETISY